MSEQKRKGGCPGPMSGPAIDRRHFLRASGAGFGLLALADMLRADEVNPFAPKAPHFAPKAKRCIFLFMVGGPSHMDMYDPKPVLNQLHGQPLPPSFGKIHSQFLEDDPICLRSNRKWGKYGKCGMDMSDLVPHMHQHADSIALIRSCAVDSVVHAPAHYQMNTGRIFMGYPSLGSWVTYGLGTENQDLPAFVVMSQPEGTPEGGAPCWGAGFLPSSYQGTLFRSGPNPILNLKPATGEFTRGQQRRTLDLLKEMNTEDLEPGDSELSAECPHLACQIKLSGDQKSFLCPCHDSHFKLDGERINKISPRAMDSLEVSDLDAADPNSMIGVKFERFRTMTEEKTPLG